MSGLGQRAYARMGRSYDRGFAVRSTVVYGESRLMPVRFPCEQKICTRSVRW
jgi:hypothetical protein